MSYRAVSFLLVSISGLALAALCLGCSAPALTTGKNEQVSQEKQSPGPVAKETGVWASTDAPESAPIHLAAYKDESGKAKDENAKAKQKITLPMAIEMCVNNNFRVLAGAEKIRQAEADMITSSLIPNPSLLADYILIPLQRVNIENELGPPQADVALTVPIDWLLFGKRVAAMQAARLGIEVSNADFADVIRTQVARTVDAFYEVLTDEEYFKLALKNVEELTDLQNVTVEMAKNKKVGELELNRMKLALHEAVLERHDRELALEVAKAKLRPLIGRTAADGDYVVDGDIAVNAVVPVPKLAEALALAEASRPDLRSDRSAIDQANAALEHERRKAKPQVALLPGWTYQNQHYINGFPNGSMLDIGISTTLPFTDRNQGNIRRAQSQVQERLFTYQGDRADALADVEASLARYADAVEHLSQFDRPETLEAALDLRKNMEAAYRAGGRKLVEMLDAHKAYGDRILHIVEFASDYWRALNRLNAAVGLKAYDPERGPTQPLDREWLKKLTGR
jgi:cobalt-zinc-cadmium efflux system outer membrane protein